VYIEQRINKFVLGNVKKSITTNQHLSFFSIGAAQCHKNVCAYISRKREAANTHNEIVIESIANALDYFIV